MKELLKYKPELIATGVLSLVLLLMRWSFATLWPETGQYDLASQTETIFWTVLRLVVYALAAWVGLRVVAPKAYQWLKQDADERFDAMTPEQKTNFSTRVYAILFGGLVLLAMSGCTAARGMDARACVVENTLAHVGEREATGHNDGPEVETYLAHVGLGKGYAWCAAFVSYNLSTCGVRNPRSAWSPAFALPADRVWTPRKASRSPRPGDVFSVYYASLGRVGHVGIITGVEGRYIHTVEGNTSGGSSREGDGVYALRRQLSKCYAVTSYIPASTDPGGTGHLRPGAGHPAAEHGGLQRAAQQRAYGHENGQYAHGNRRYAKRYATSGAWCGGDGHCAVAPQGHRPAVHHGTQREGLDHRECAGQHAHLRRGVRHCADRRHALGAMDAIAYSERGERYHRAHRGAACYPALGLVRARGSSAAGAVGAATGDQIGLQGTLN